MVNVEFVIILDSEIISGIGKLDFVMLGGEEKVFFFGIKLRRINYFLRFYCD